MAALYRLLGARTPERGEVLAALAVAAAYTVFGVAAYDPQMASGDADWSSPAALFFTVAWLAAMLVGGWTLGARWGVAYAVGISLLTVPIAYVAAGHPPALGLVTWATSVLVALVFGGLAGAMADHYREAKLRTLQLAQKNEELRQASDALARSDAMFREFADRIDLGMWILPGEGAPLYTNAAVRRMVGALDATEASWRDHVHPDDRAHVEATVQALRRGEPQDVEYRVKLPGQEPRWVRSQSFAVLGADGRATSYAGLLEDVTERKEREAKREVIERRERLSALGTLVAGVAHEINNPLTYVMGNMELARLEHERLARSYQIPAEDAVRYERLMTTSFEGSQRIARIVRALRAVTRGRQGEAIEDVNLNAIATNVHALMRTGVPEHVALELSLNPTDPIVRGSSGELHQILLNLATNAVQAMGEKQGRVVIETRIDGHNAVLAVRDEGPGIAPEVRARLFTPFFTTKPEGTGLGLSIAHSIVADHGGEIDVESRPGDGAVFRVRLPRVAAPALREVVI